MDSRKFGSRWEKSRTCRRIYISSLSHIQMDRESDKNTLIVGKDLHRRRRRLKAQAVILGIVMLQRCPNEMKYTIFPRRKREPTNIIHLQLSYLSRMSDVWIAAGNSYSRDLR